MKELVEFIESNEVDYTSRTIDIETIHKAESLIGISFGKQMIEYLSKYGYLGFEYSELYGMNSNQGLDSDMITQTLYLHKYYPQTQKYIALENQGEGDYFIVDADDKVYEFDSQLMELSELNISLFEYILERFQEIKNS